MNHDFDLSFTQWYNCFGFVNNDTYIHWANGLLTPSPLEHFHSMALYNNVPKGGDIECPAIRFLYYVIANTLQARDKFTRVNEEDMLVLAKATIPKCNMTLNWAPSSCSIWTVKPSKPMDPLFAVESPLSSPMLLMYL
jgi:hypothetical protein